MAKHRLQQDTCCSVLFTQLDILVLTIVGIRYLSTPMFVILSRPAFVASLIC